MHLNVNAGSSSPAVSSFGSSRSGIAESFADFTFASEEL